ncbi:LysM peptidoglycan-binding domain-containing M23 family metallopeptidase [Paracoccus tegillarcae]|uniref:Peptidase M23 n=1 Tax=Paracoccus tegillarcae TaxID=1529068 RepID=A0A2K9ETK2_9RHOB|nr:LysM peptidoglycan-binding domain-containing M23 family metallopeptidase [Paracoccus tegillarcae]AUH32554.1 peptidase M23 [Paracoccus tegillarcae]
MGSRSRSLAVATLSVAVLASCGGNGMFDPDLRGIFSGPLDTAQAAQAAQPRPKPDSRGLISYPDYQVAIANQGDTVSTIAARLGLSPRELAQHNAIDANAVLTPGAVVALPRRVAPGAPAAGATVSSTGQVSDPFAGQGARQPTTPSTSGAAATQTTTDGAQPRQHQVAAGETAWSIARKYDVTVADLASWNGLPSDMTIRVGQRLLIPVAGQSPSPAQETVTTPGSGSPTPRPPSAAQPLPAEKTEPAATPVETPDSPDLGASRTQASGSGRFQMPVAGAIIRTYQKGRNDGIDISAPQGTSVKAAGSGTVAAITRDTDGVPIVVIRHSGDLMTVYAGLDNLQVAKDATVSAGQSLGTSAASGILHFEIRRGFESVDPEEYLN